MVRFINFNHLLSKKSTWLHHGSPWGLTTTMFTHVPPTPVLPSVQRLGTASPPAPTQPLHHRRWVPDGAGRRRRGHTKPGHLRVWSGEIHHGFSSCLMGKWTHWNGFTHYNRLLPIETSMIIVIMVIQFTHWNCCDFYFQKVVSQIIAIDQPLSTSVFT